MTSLLVALALALVAGAGAFAWLGAATATPTEHEITIRYSRFEPATVRVPAGQPVRFRLVNDDPIDHEWIVGDEDLHERHRTGTEPVHDTRPTEVTLPALATRETTVTFTDPGRYRFVCHLPGHEAYGMVGEVIVAGAG